MTKPIHHQNYWRHENGCPRLFLAPMEGLGDRFFRKAIATIGGFDEACTEFLRVPKNAHVQSLAKKYNPHETYPIPQAAQVMGDDPNLVPAMGRELEKRGAHRIDLNCGCPSNTVVGRGAGSSLLKNPERLYQVTKALVDGVNIPVTAKLRSGYEDTSLFRENMLAAEESGIVFLTLHPRTKVEGYTPPARWELITQAKELLTIPVVGSGDITTVSDAKKMAEETLCDGLMVGRGAVANPWIFHDILSLYSNETSPKNWTQTEEYFRHFAYLMAEVMPVKTQINKMKQMINFIFRSKPTLEVHLPTLLKSRPTSPSEYMEQILSHWKQNYT